MQRSGPRPAQPTSRAGVGPTSADAATSPAVAEATPASPSGSTRVRSRGSSGVFEESAAQEYAYVASDVRRIALIGGSLFAVLIALWLLIEVLGVIHL